MKKSDFTAQLKLIFRKELVFLSIICLAIFIRVWRLDTHMIFFGDIGRDLLAAKQMVEDKTIPLLGIPSSVPRFRQGPLMIWYEAFWLALGNMNPVSAGYGASLISILSIVLLYWVVKKTVNQPVAWISSFILATSPLAIAHARMPYHITPIPFATIVFLIALYRLWRKKPYGLFFATLAWGFLFQFELATAPLLLLVPYVLWRTKQEVKTFPPIFSIVTGLTIGLLPQLIFDLTHRFQHLGGFMIWVTYRIVAFGGYKGEHTVGVDRLTKTAELFTQYFTRMFSFDQIAVLGAVVLIGLVAIFRIWKARQKLPIFMEITAIAFSVLTLAYIVHGAPSEAYFPPFLIYLPVLIGYAVWSLHGMIARTLVVIVIGLGLFNVYSVVTHNFFIGNPLATVFSYGPSYQEHLQVSQKILNSTQNRPYQLRSTSPGSEHYSYLDNFRYLTEWQGHPESAEPAVLFFIEYPDSALLNYPLATIYTFPTFKVVKIE